MTHPGPSSAVLAGLVLTDAGRSALGGLAPDVPWSVTALCLLVAVIVSGAGGQGVLRALVVRPAPPPGRDPAGTETVDRCGRTAAARSALGAALGLALVVQIPLTTAAAAAIAQVDVADADGPLGPVTVPLALAAVLVWFVPARREVRPAPTRGERAPVLAP